MVASNGWQDSYRHKMTILHETPSQQLCVHHAHLTVECSSPTPCTKDEIQYTPSMLRKIPPVDTHNVCTDAKTNSLRTLRTCIMTGNGIFCENIILTTSYHEDICWTNVSAQTSKTTSVLSFSWCFSSHDYSTLIFIDWGSAYLQKPVLCICRLNLNVFHQYK